MYPAHDHGSSYSGRYPPPGPSVRYLTTRQEVPPPYSTYRRRPSPVEEFPGPLHIPSEPRLQPTYSPSSSSYSSDSLRSPSPPPTWRARGDTTRHENLPPIHHLTSSVDWHRDGHAMKPPAFLFSSRSGNDPSSHHRHHDDAGPLTYAMPSRVEHSSSLHADEASLSSPQKTKFGVRRGSRFYCTYVSPLTGERCATWDQGWTVYATLNRHAESDHAHEELELIKQGRLAYSQAQIVTSKEKQQKIEEHLATTGKCPDCGTVFSSNRKDSLTRHKQTSACEKAQKRGRPPTKFPKKPKGQGYQVMDTESDDGY